MAEPIKNGSQHRSRPRNADGKAVSTPAPKPPAQISPARIAAFEILERVASTTDHSDDLLHGRRLAGLSQADKNLATTLVLGVLRWQIALDAQIKPWLQRPDLALASPVATALRLGVFQLTHLDRVPAHAALSESVELVRAANHSHATGMVNAVLRKVASAPAVKPKLYEPTEALAERLGHPRWLVERWVKNYGRAAAIAVCDYDQKEPEAGDLFLGVEDNAPRMDDGSRLVAEIAAALLPDATRIWDACAAPGGKTQVLARRHPNAGLLATDLSPRRLQAMAERLERELPGSKIRTLAADAAKLPTDEGEFDLILCDVPCSGTGTLARNPEIRHKLEPAELSRQARRQREILAGALERLSPGGRLLYSTCSLEPEENEAVVAEVLVSLKPSSGIERLPLDSMVDGLFERGILQGERYSNLLRDGNLRTLPGNGFQGDGFFAAGFRKS